MRCPIYSDILNAEVNFFNLGTMAFTFGILTISDSCSSGEKEDHSGPALCALVKEFYPQSKILLLDCIPDDYEAIKAKLIEWCDVKKCNVVLTTGGTGFAPRDVTPEATRDVLDKLAPAVTQHINHMSMQVTPMAMLSRAVCGVRKQTLILNLPGSKKASVECFGFVGKTLKHAVELMLDRKAEVVKAHQIVQGTIVGDDTEKSKVKLGCVALRNRKSPYPMVSVEEAQEIMSDCDNMYRFEPEQCIVKIEDSLGRTLATTVRSNVPLPPFPASTKDGYAVIAADGPGIRKVVEVIAAGDLPAQFTLKSGEIIRISTGAPLPNGADAVVQVEDTELVKASDDNMKELEVKINVSPSVGLDIRPIGSDIPVDEDILHQGTIITPAHIGIMAAVGITEIDVYVRRSVGIISSGNELQRLGCGQLQSGKIFDSNKLTLLSLLEQHNFKGYDCGIARDDPDDIKQKISAALAKHDTLITTGGVSMGEFDLIKQVLVQDFNASIHFGRVDMKPGKPTTFATCEFKGKWKCVFALPGNPVSASVTFLLFVLPFLRRYIVLQEGRQMIDLILDKDVNLDVRPEYMRVKISSDKNGRKLAQFATANQISSRLNSLAEADALLVLPSKSAVCSKLLKGAIVKAIPLRNREFYVKY